MKYIIGKYIYLDVEILLTRECSFRGEDFLNFIQSETIIAHGDHVFCAIGME